MRAALARVDIPAVVAIFRAAAGLSQLELGNLVVGWSQSLVSLTERGLRDTRYDIRKLLAFADAVGMPRKALLPLILGRALLPQALRHFAHARRMLDESDYTAAIGRELLVVTADLGIYSAWFAYDANNQPLARQLHGEAALLADSAGDSAQCVLVYANMAQQCTSLAAHTGRPGFARVIARWAGGSTVMSTASMPFLTMSTISASDILGIRTSSMAR